MAELHLTDIDDEVLARLQKRAEEEDRSVENLIRDELERAVSLASPDEPVEAESFVR